MPPRVVVVWSHKREPNLFTVYINVFFWSAEMNLVRAFTNILVFQLTQALTFYSIIDNTQVVSTTYCEA